MTRNQLKKENRELKKLITKLLSRCGSLAAARSIERSRYYWAALNAGEYPESEYPT